MFEDVKRIHFISIGGAVMHNLALELQARGYKISGSDDEIYDPSRSRLVAKGLLPDKLGWDVERISRSLDLILLGMHARKNNPELLKAKELEIPILSFPEFVGEFSKGKFQVVIAGSHGKTTTTSIIMHVLKENGIDHDYLVGAQLEGFDRMVRLSNAPYIIIEGDEYLSSPIDPRPKFLHYDPDVLVVTGLKWDHMNVFPTEESYTAAFRNLYSHVKESCSVFYDTADHELSQLLQNEDWPFQMQGYKEIEYSVKDGVFRITAGDQLYPLALVGKHNMKNIAAAWCVCKQLGLDYPSFLNAVTKFKGASKRLDKVLETKRITVYRDFAHAPSKVKATAEGIRELYPERKFVAVSELHTYSSLNRDFLPQYSGALNSVDKACVFFSPKTLEIKRMQPLSQKIIRAGFDRNDLDVFNSPQMLEDWLKKECEGESIVLLLMSSGTFGGLKLPQLLSSL